MGITAKELAKELGVSPSAVSLALNGRPGISTKTRKRIVEAARIYHVECEHLSEKNKRTGSICFAAYIKNGKVIFDSPFIHEVEEGVRFICEQQSYHLDSAFIYETKDPAEQLEHIIEQGYDGLIILGTEMQQSDFTCLKDIRIPIVLIDTYCELPNIDCVVTNNRQGAYNATDYLIKNSNTQPGYLHSSYRMYAFDERKEGFYQAIRHNCLPTYKSIVHELLPTMEGAYSDMMTILKAKEDLASCYFADNDEIALGAIRALKEMGYRIPEDISIIGFDNIPESACSYPRLTTIHIPKHHLGKTAAQRLFDVIQSQEHYAVKIEVSTSLIQRNSA